MTGLRPYEKYRSVKYDYVSQLPVDWELLPNIAIFQERKERGTENEEILSISAIRGIVKSSDYENKKDRTSDDKSQYLLVKEGDLAYNTMLMWDGAVGHSDFRGIVSPAYTVLKTKMKINPKFFHYQVRTEFYKNYSRRFSYGIVDARLRLYYVHFKRMYSIVPPLEVQNSIVAHLDKKNNKIDKFIRNKERLIELAIENKEKEIWKIVSGKNLKANKVKNSSIKCIGEIPDSWDVKNLNYISNVVLGKMLCNENKGNYKLKPYLKSKNIGWESVIVNEVDEMWYSKNEMKTYRIHKNDLLVSEGGEVGKTCIWNDEIKECYIQNSVHKITFKKNMNPIFFLYYLYTLGKSSYFKSIVNQVSIGHLTREKLVKVKCIVPPFEIQNNLVEQILEQIELANTIIFKAQKELFKIEEYREALITDLVTGKRSVPEPQRI